MKRTITVLVIIIVIVLTGCSSQNVIPAYPQYHITIPSSAGEIPAVTFELPKTLPAFPDKAMVYRTVKPEITLEMVSEIGAKLGLKGEPAFSQQEAAYHMSDSKDTLLSVYPATGAISLTTGKLYTTKSPELPSFEEAAAIATTFLDERGWLPPGLKIDEVKIGGTSGGIPDHLLVTFDYRIDGFKVTGPGKKYGVRIAHKGEIAYLQINPVECSPYETAPIKNVEQAFQELKENRKYTISIDATKVMIDSVSLEYWVGSMKDGQEYVIPVFTFKGRSLGESDKLLSDSFTGWVEAVK
jgi:hypothetical protein